MKLDKELYRQAYQQYQRWNEAELVDRARNAGKLTPQAAWRQYVALVEFCWKLCPQQSEWQREQHLAEFAEVLEKPELLAEYRHLLARVRAL